MNRVAIGLLLASNGADPEVYFPPEGKMEPDELERVIFFERAKEEAEQAFEKDPRDASALTRWGGALLELAHFRQGHDAYDMIEMVGAPKFSDKT